MKRQIPHQFWEMYLKEIETGSENTPSLRLRKEQRWAKKEFFQVQCLSLVEGPVLANSMREV